MALIPFAGTLRTFLALALSAVAAPPLPRRYLAIPLAIAAVIALPSGPIKRASDFGRVIYETETPYQYARA